MEGRKGEGKVRKEGIIRLQKTVEWVITKAGRMDKSTGVQTADRVDRLNYRCTQVPKHEQGKYCWLLLLAAPPSQFAQVNSGQKK